MASKVPGDCVCFSTVVHVCVLFKSALSLGSSAALYRDAGFRQGFVLGHL